MSNDTKPQHIHVGRDVYINSDEADGLFERDIVCVNCEDHIGAWQYDTEDSTVELFYPYWMCDEDNNHNLCEYCHDRIWTDSKEEGKVQT